MAGRGAALTVRWLVDAMNVVGSRPDGWWRDKPAAVERLLEALERFAEHEDEVAVVLDAGRPEQAGRRGNLEVAIAPRRGPDAADDEIVARLERDPDPGSVLVVTSDAKLSGRVRSLGAQVEPARRFRDRLDAG